MRVRTHSAVVVAALVGAVAALGTTAAADFVDTTNSPFATEIRNVTDAGCISGFAGNTFRPRDIVNRQQFAAWLSRCGGRVEFGDNGTQALTTDGETDVAAAQVRSGAIASGGGFVLATATLEVTGGPTPGDVTFRLYRGTGGPIEVVTLTAPADAAVGGSAVEVVPVPGDALTPFRVSAQRAAGVAVDVDVSLALLYVPFAGDGTGGGTESGS